MSRASDSIHEGVATLRFRPATAAGKPAPHAAGPFDVAPAEQRNHGFGSVLLTGLLWLLGALGLALPWTRRAAGWSLLLLVIAVTPVHVYMLQAHDRFPSLPLWLLWARLPLQGVVLWVVWWGSRWRKPPRGLLY